MKTRYYLITGRVQGVSFRYYIQKKAIRLSINGTVRNLFDGDVEVYAQGEPENLDEFEGYLSSGPPLAQVSGVRKEERDIPETFPGFNIVY